MIDQVHVENIFPHAFPSEFFHENESTKEFRWKLSCEAFELRADVHLLGILKKK